MYKHLSLTLTALLSVGCLFSCQSGNHKGPEQIEIVHSTDVHGNAFSFDLLSNREGTGSYERISSYVTELRKGPNPVLLLDDGDILQGQPTSHYFNYVDTSSIHLFSRIFNYLKYDAINVGNHDIEAGPSVYNRFREELDMPLLGANIVDVEKSKATGKEVPYFTPYTIVKKGNRNIAVLGLITPGVSNYLPERLWAGMRFDDIVTTAQKWVPKILEEKPDLVVALIHSGRGSDRDTPQPYAENAGRDLAKAVDGIDLVLLGHDHRVYIDSVQRPDGRIVYLLNPGPNGDRVGKTTVTFIPQEDGSTQITIEPDIVDMDAYEPDWDYLEHFRQDFDAVQDYVNKPIGEFTSSMDSRSSLFGPSAFVDLIHQVQMEIFPESDISLTAPLTTELQVDRGPLYTRDLFKLYKYENTPILLSFTGREIKGILEESYDRWIQTMHKPSDPLFYIDPDPNATFVLSSPYFNYDSAYGIDYTVDVSKPKGSRITITSSSFDPDKKYRVVANSYRASGGGGIFTKGAGLSRSELQARILDQKSHDLRYYVQEYIKKKKVIDPKPVTHWSFIPASLVDPAIKRDSALIFGR